MPIKRTELFAKINFFLAERVPRTGEEWGHVSRGDLHELQDIISHLIDGKWERDVDRDCSVEARLVDRTRVQRLAYDPVPYPRTGWPAVKLTRETLDSAFEVAVTNMSAAAREVKTLIQLSYILKEREMASLVKMMEDAREKGGE